MENVTTKVSGTGGMRESNPAWRSRDLPPSPQLSEKMLKVTDWLNRGSAGRYIRAVDDPRYKDQAGDHARGHTFLMQAVISNNDVAGRRGRHRLHGMRWIDGIGDSGGED